MRALRVVDEGVMRPGNAATDSGADWSAGVEGLLQEISALRRELAALRDRIPETLPYVVAREDQAWRMVALDEIEQIEADGNYVLLRATRATYRHRVTLATLERRLDSARFIRVHRSVIVNITAIRSITGWFSGSYMIELRSGEKVRVSRSYWQQLADRLSLDG